ncbi:MAG: homoserine O-succinyltransferase, partial [Anaerotruncus sp.]|nr:homoserine O-succinyltransferase [Anaerotruncus sp.]
LLQVATHKTKNTSKEHMLKFYKTFDEICHNKYDGMIITGAPLADIAFEDVDFWDELCKIFDWAETNVYSTINLCWGAFAALYYKYNINPVDLPQKLFGVYPHYSLDVTHPLMRGLDDVFFVPQSREWSLNTSDIAKIKDLQIISYSDEAGIHIISDMECRNFYVTGHSEYDRDTLAKEYFRDLDKGLPIQKPANYFPNDDINLVPKMNWKSAGNLIFSNWLNYFVYQKTPYDLSTL